MGLYFTLRNGPIFRAKTDLSDLQSSGEPWVKKLVLYDYCYLCIQEILVLTKSAVRRSSVHSFM